MKKERIFKANTASGEVVIRLMSRIERNGECVVKFLKTGPFEVKQGEVVKDFNLTHGVVKFEEEKERYSSEYHGR